MPSFRHTFTRHPNSVGETYCQHLVSALFFAGYMLVGAFVCLVHALLPFLFVKTGSTIIERLHCRMVTARQRHAHQAEFVHHTQSAVGSAKVASPTP